MLAILFLALVALASINALTILCFWLDKQRARRGDWRISEANLLGLAMIGGTPGALLARHLFRHKRRKEPFSTCLLLIAALQIGAALGLHIAFS
jgi:uncharacterized membrane protein YsdA (DUF1294 family)